MTADELRRISEDAIKKHYGEALDNPEFIQLYDYVQSCLKNSASNGKRVHISTEINGKFLHALAWKLRSEGFYVVEFMDKQLSISW